jgi:DNA (cytosine-5)-methyltransferase 1
MTHGSLFSGIGGFDLAAEWMGWENVFHCEWNEFGQKVLHHYWPKAIQYNDITKTDFTIHRGKIDILTGGFPCQPYSSAGKRKGKEDERHLWPEMLRAIREIQPRWVVGENVFGLVNWSRGLVFHEVQADLEAAGYEVWPYVLAAASVGAPHRRDRVWFVAYAKLYANGLQTERGMDLGGELLERPKREEKTNGLNNISKNERLTPHPNSNGLNQCNGNNEKQPGEGGEHALSNADTGDEYGDVADTKSQPGEWMRPELRKFSQQKQRESGGTHSQMGNNVADTNGIRLRGESNGIGKSRFTNEASKIGNWQNFPTQSPICSRNDGLSSRLDGITFSKWRNESIKAAGNAIVPQVVLQIFKTIEQFKNL